MQEPEAVEPLPQTPEMPIPRISPGEETIAQRDPAHHFKDHVDLVMEGWKRERPDLNVESIGIITRLDLLQAHLRSEVAAVFERSGLTSPSFAVIATLRRVGSPYQLSQRAIMDALQLTGGTISVRIDRLERDGIVERVPDPHDQRGVLVHLTEKGEQLFDQVAPLHLANEDRLLSALNGQQRTELATLLRTLLLSFDALVPEDPRHPSHWLGAGLVPAPDAWKIRRSSGLPPRSGLLVQDVIPHGSAATAGLQEGDLIISANGLATRSIERLYEQLLAAHDRTLTLEILRGTEQRSVLWHE